MKHRTRIAVASGVITLAIVGVGAVVVAASIDDDGGDTPIVGPDLARATQAALAHTGQGRVTSTEVGDEDSYYEVEVTLDDGSQVDVQLDRSFHVVATMADDESNDESIDGDDNGAGE